ncbi:uncharacterized protein N7506_008857 [Penicillium brevicompactum]|uniref:uncharacterized protein n=1 Tax=Penicillium brevicompactum TaxID=5074 RepID=UPI002540FAA4|nr:uncharacterized protein N7506_008857 [Penicillium brevicompactum]KAJ5325755.1 hypothetical protein N7506_008857 [Penicillium brevicompactum]
MNPFGTIGSALQDSIISNSALKEAIDIGSYLTDRSKRLKDIALDDTQKHKIRRILNHFLIPTISPKFVDDDDHESHDDKCVPDSWLSNAEEELKTPARMIDIDTMNMVPTYNLGLQDQYCIVSHSWKGSELTYGYFNEAKSFKPKKDSVGAESQQHSNDVSNTVNKCKSDIEDLEKRINDALPHVRARSDDQRPQDIGTLLQWYADANAAEWSLGNSQKKLHDAKATVASADREAEFYTDLMQSINKLNRQDSSADKSAASPQASETPQTPEITRVDSAIQTPTKESQESSISSQTPEMAQVKSAIETLKEEARQNSALAEEKHQKAVESRNEIESTIVFFDKNRELCYGIEALLVALQHIRSSRKILESIAQTKKLFDKHFPGGGKRYVWLDTCCINKADSFELSESLSLMGDWYANADLCLVHLDTPRDEMSWIEEWKYWKNPSHVPVPLNMTSYDQIGSGVEAADKAKYQVEWATRGWTLQELVLSKVTYYVNSHWQNLPRPIEVLGPLYFLRAFLPSYLSHPFVKKHKGDSLHRINELKKLLSPEFIKPGMSEEQELTTILQTLGFVSPRSLKETLAECQIGKAVVTASRHMTNVVKDLLSKKNMSDNSSLLDLTDDDHLTEKVTLFNDLLYALAELTSEQILDDRRFIAGFSNVKNMTNWIGGSLGDCSASTSLVAASQRVTTVSTDQAYSLMGILGVRFAAFPAEGLPKALARLLDEVVISYNDVSVFNWTGKHRGSHLQGRSLYPTSIDAFVDPANNPLVKSKAQTSKHILDLFRAQRVRQSKTATEINKILTQMLASSKELPDECSFFETLSKLAIQIRETSFEKLEAHIGRLEVIVKELDKFVSEESKKSGDESKNDSVSGKPNKPTRMDSFPKSLKTPKIEVPKFSFGRKKASAQPTEKAEPVGPEIPGTSDTGEADAQEAQYKELDSKIQDVLKALSDPKEREGEERTDKELALDAQPDASTSTGEERHSSPVEEGKRMVCPNPITVGSGGIRGVFDIQRIIVTMIEPQILRSRVRSAVKGQKIDGWCTISTGLSVTLVAFSVERDILEQQLDLAEVINSFLEPEEPKSTSSGSDSGSGSGSGSSSGSGSATNQPSQNDGVLFKTPEQAKVARMINFVQKPNLEGIAGEWVLTRFSGVPGAKWFLSQLVLGAGNDFYGQRIATDAFSFEDAAPEQGLTQYWHQFTMEKKNRTCDTLGMYLKRQKMFKAAGNEWRQALKIEGNSEESDKTGFQGELESIWDVVENISVEKVVNVGKLSGFGIRGIGAGIWASHLEDRIEKGALKRVPVSLRTPVRDLDQNRKLLPAMFHAGREMHMF